MSTRPTKEYVDKTPHAVGGLIGPPCGYMLSPLVRLVPPAGTCSLPSSDWSPLRVYALPEWLYFLFGRLKCLPHSFPPRRCRQTGAACLQSRLTTDPRRRGSPSGDRRRSPIRGAKRADHRQTDLTLTLTLNLGLGGRVPLGAVGGHPIAVLAGGVQLALPNEHE
eukprot:1036368-Prorocentrum_minimum.AAC.1